MSDENITVFLADDHAMVCDGLAALLASQQGISIVGQCGNGLEVVKKILEVKPDVVILDITMPGLNGLDICYKLSRKAKYTSVLVLTMHDDERLIVRAMENGASGYLLKESAAERLTEAVRAVAKGDVYFGPGIPKTVLRRLSRGGDDPYNRLTSREREVLQLVAEGKTSRKIAEVLNIAVKTVDTHRSRLMHKLNIHDQSALVKYAFKRGIIWLQR